MGLNRDRSDLLRLRSLGDAQAHKRHWVKIIQSTSAEPVKLHQTTAIEPLPPKAVVDHGHSCSDKSQLPYQNRKRGPKVLVERNLAQAPLWSGRVKATSQMPTTMHLPRESADQLAIESSKKRWSRRGPRQHSGMAGRECQVQSFHRFQTMTDLGIATP